MRTANQRGEGESYIRYAKKNDLSQLVLLLRQLIMDRLYYRRGWVEGFSIYNGVSRLRATAKAVDVNCFLLN